MERAHAQGFDVGSALKTAIGCANEAGDLILGGWRRDVIIDHKGAIDLVTQYDRQSEALVKKRLKAAFASHVIVAEESAPITLPITDETLVWYVDPIDGTTNFAHGHPFYCVSIALYRGAAPLLGVVHAPALGITWHAETGAGAYRNGQPCRVSKTRELSQAICATGFPYDRWHNPDNNVAEFVALLQRTRGVRRCGSAAIDLCMVGDGTYDLYWERNLKAWDMCAGAVVVLEAGGTLSDYGGSAADPRTGRLVATNGLLHTATIEVLSDVEVGNV